MAVKWEDFLAEVLSGAIRANRRLHAEQARARLEEEFEIEHRDEDVPRLKPRELDIKLDSHDVPATEQDLVGEPDILGLIEFEIDLETDLDLVEIPEDEQTEDGDVFQIETNARKGLFSRNTHVSIKAKLSTKPEEHGLKAYKSQRSTEINDHLRGFGKHERRKDE